MTFKTKSRQDIAWLCGVVVLCGVAVAVYNLLLDVHQNLGYVFVLFMLKRIIDSFLGDVLQAKIEWGNASLPVKVAGSKTKYRRSASGPKQCGHEETDEL